MLSYKVFIQPRSGESTNRRIGRCCYNQTKEGLSKKHFFCHSRVGGNLFYNML